MAVFDITNLCNLSCVYCNRYMSEKIDAVKEPAYDEIIGIFKDITKTQIKQLALQGGEPFMRKDLYDIIEEMSDIKSAVHMNVKASWKCLAEKQLIKNKFFLASYVNMKQMKFPIISVTTNGTIYNPRLQELFFQKNIHMEVSLDTTIAEIHNRKRSGGRDTFTTVTNNIREYAKNLPVVIKSTIDSDNVNNMIELIDYAHELDCVQIIFHPVRFVGKALNGASRIDWIEQYVEQVKEIIELGIQKKLPILVEIILPVNFLRTRSDYLEMNQRLNMSSNLVLNFHSCTANQAIEEIYITSCLDVYGCPQLLHFDEMKIGNLRDISILDIEHSHRYKKLQQMIKDRTNIKLCSGCDLVNACKGGCVAAGLVNENQVNGNDLVCCRKGVGDNAV